jgi:hypothetical protein
MFLESRAWLVHRADNLVAICQLIVYTVWDLQHLTTLQDSLACYRPSFTLFYLIFISLCLTCYTVHTLKFSLTPTHARTYAESCNLPVCFLSTTADLMQSTQGYYEIHCVLFPKCAAAMAIKATFFDLIQILIPKPFFQLRKYVLICHYSAYK